MGAIRLWVVVVMHVFSEEETTRKNWWGNIWLWHCSMDEGGGNRRLTQPLGRDAICGRTLPRVLLCTYIPVLAPTWVHNISKDTTVLMLPCRTSWSTVKFLCTAGKSVLYFVCHPSMFFLISDLSTQNLYTQQQTQGFPKKNYFSNNHTELSKNIDRKKHSPLTSILGCSDRQEPQ